MPQSFYQVAATVPVHRFTGLGFVHAGLEIQGAPESQQAALVIGKLQFVRTAGLIDRLDRTQVGKQRIRVGPRNTGVFGIREGRIQQAAVFRSEEHTSELQSLMRISYAVFCLNKKNTIRDTLP